MSHLNRALSITLLYLLLGCVTENPNLTGLWNATNYLQYISDTIVVVFDSERNIDLLTVKTDSGMIVISAASDSVISVNQSKATDVLHFEYDDDTHGILSIYELNPPYQNLDEDIRYTAKNYNFFTFSENQNHYLVIDHQFNPFGRSLDTISYDIVSDRLLILAEDTLMRIKS